VDGRGKELGEEHMTEEVQDLQRKAQEAKALVVSAEAIQRKTKMAWEQAQADLNKARERANHAESEMHSTPGASPDIPVPSYDDLLRQVTIQCPDKSHQERIAMIAQMRHAFAMDGVGANFQRSHAGHVTGGEVQNVGEHNYNVPTATEVYGPIGEKKSYG
jgi:hypothetical protein